MSISVLVVSSSITYIVFCIVLHMTRYMFKLAYNILFIQICRCTSCVMGRVTLLRSFVT